jgi:hypothetical protein
MAWPSRRGFKEDETGERSVKIEERNRKEGRNPTRVVAPIEEEEHAVIQFSDLSQEE